MYSTSTARMPWLSPVAFAAAAAGRSFAYLHAIFTRSLLSILSSPQFTSARASHRRLFSCPNNLHNAVLIWSDLIWIESVARDTVFVSAQVGNLWRVPHLGGYGDVRARTLHCVAVYSMAVSRFSRVLDALRSLPEWSDAPTGPRFVLFRFGYRGERIENPLYSKLTLLVLYSGTVQY